MKAVKRNGVGGRGQRRHIECRALAMCVGGGGGWVNVHAHKRAYLCARGHWTKECECVPVRVVVRMRARVCSGTSAVCERMPTPLALTHYAGCRHMMLANIAASLGVACSWKMAAGCLGVGACAQCAARLFPAPAPEML